MATSNLIGGITSIGSAIANADSGQFFTYQFWSNVPLQKELSQNNEKTGPQHHVKTPHRRLTDEESGYNRRTLPAPPISRAFISPRGAQSTGRSPHQMRILDLITPKDLSRVAKLQMLARQVVEGLCSGRHRSPHKGFSVEFKEHRPYVRGDELKDIDWKVFAKSDRLYIREFEEDTNLRCTLVVDRSGSMRYRGERSEGRSKYEYAQQLAASLAYLMLGQQDTVGLITFDDDLRDQLPPRSRPSHLQSLLSALAIDSSKRETDLGGVFRKIASKLGRRGLVIIISDAMGDTSSISRSLAHIRSSKHEVLFFQIMDPDEVDFPFSGRIQFRDLEQVDNEHTVEAISIREAYLKRLRDHEEKLRAACRTNKVDLIRLTTDRPFADALHEYLALRRRLR